jgi:hypothetical protein
MSDKKEKKAGPKTKMYRYTTEDGQVLAIVDKDEIESTGGRAAIVKESGRVLKKGEQPTEANVYKVQTSKSRKFGPGKMYQLVKTEQGVFKTYDPNKKKKDPAVKKRAKPDGDAKKKKKKAAPKKKKVKVDSLNAQQLAQVMAIINATK